MCSHYDHHPACRCDGSTPTASEYDVGIAHAPSTEELGGFPPLLHGEGVHLFGTPYHEPFPYDEPSQHQGPPSGYEAVGEAPPPPYSEIRHHHRPRRSAISRRRRPLSHNASALGPPDFHPNNPYAGRHSGGRPQSISSQVPDHDVSYLEEQQRELLASDRRISMPRPGDPTHDPEYPADWRPPPLRRSNAFSRGGHAPRPTLDFPARGEYRREDDWESGRVPVHDGAQRNVEYVEGERRPSFEAEIEYYEGLGTGMFSLPPHLR